MTQAEIIEEILQYAAMLAAATSPAAAAAEMRKIADLLINIHGTPQ